MRRSVRLGLAAISGADLTGADLHRASLDGARLEQADFWGAVRTDRVRCKDGSVGRCGW